MEIYSPSDLEHSINIYLDKRWNVTTDDILYSLNGNRLPYIILCFTGKNDEIFNVEVEGYSNYNRLSETGKIIIDREVGVLKLLGVL